MVGDGMGKVTKGKKTELAENKKKSIGISYYDFNLTFLILFACSIGLIIIYSASAYIAKSKNLESTYFLYRQLMTLAFGIFLMFVFFCDLNI